jgi:hypothetical protein
VKTVSTILIVICLIASLYYLVVGLVKPETVVVYNNANIPLWGIRLWAFIGGVGGVLLLFPQTFKFAGSLMILNSMFTIACFVVIRDLKGGVIEFVLLQIPIFILWGGYPWSILAKLPTLR